MATCLKSVTVLQGVRGNMSNWGQGDKITLPYWSHRGLLVIGPQEACPMPGQGTGGEGGRRETVASSVPLHTASGAWTPLRKPFAHLSGPWNREREGFTWSVLCNGTVTASYPAQHKHIPAPPPRPPPAPRGCVSITCPDRWWGPTRAGCPALWPTRPV